MNGVERRVYLKYTLLKITERIQRNMSFDSINSSTSLEERYFYDSDSDGASNDENDDQICTDLNANDGFYKHIVLPSDTLQGICLQYKVSSTKLKKINRFSGSTLLLAPKVLNIPKQPGVFPSFQNTESKEFKIHYVLAKYPHLKIKEISVILENNDWSLLLASKSIKNELDLEFTRQSNISLDIDSFKTRNRMVNGIMKEIPISFFGQSIDMNAPSYGTSGFINACIGMDYGDIEMKELSMS